MTHPASNLSSSDVPARRQPDGAQTLLRGLAVIEAVAFGCDNLRTIGEYMGTTRSTTHRLVSCLVRERYLRQTPDKAFALGSRLIELGFQAHHEIALPELARPWLEALADATSDTVHLAVRDGNEALYLHKISGKRGLEMRSRIGCRMPLATTAIGKALILDEAESEWENLHAIAGRQPQRDAFAHAQIHRDMPDRATWQARLRHYASVGYAFDLEENEATICCVAAPIRGANGGIVAALSVSSTTSYMPLHRMQEVVPVIQGSAGGIARELGWKGAAA
jgi:DNA-binding IclR family transcriptional regulator